MRFFSKPSLSQKSVDINEYRHHLSEGRCRDRLSRGIVDIRRRLAESTSFNPTPTFECDECLEQNDFHRLDLASLLEHSHPNSSGFELYLSCKACQSEVPLCDAVAHAAYAHAEWIRQSPDALANIYVTAPEYLVVKSEPVQDMRPNLFSSVARDSTLIGWTSLEGESPPDLEQRSEKDETYCSPHIDVDKSADNTNDSDADTQQSFRKRKRRTRAVDEPDFGAQSKRVEPLKLKTRSIYPPGTNPDDAHYVDGDNNYRCITCCKRFSTRSAIRTHHRAIHRGERPFVCLECGIAFAQRGQLKEHVVHVHEEAHQRRYRCPTCRQVFSWKSSLARHRRNTHGGRNQRDELRGRYECDNCGMIFSWLYELQYHEVRHTAAFSYACKACSKFFIRRDELKRHRTRVHSTQPRQFAC